MGKFDGWLLVSDFDGTLIGNDAAISKENVAAIQHFVSEGGRFSGATGRTECNVRPFMAGLPINTPWILYNGSGIYDFCWNRFIWRGKLNRALAEPFAARMIARHPNVNVQIHAGGPYFETNPANPIDAEVVHEKQEYIVKPLSETPDCWMKVLFGCNDSATLRAVESAYYLDPIAAESHSMYSGERYFEFTPPGVNKGMAMQILCEKLTPAVHTVVAIGDYLNDLEMVQLANIGAAPESAHPEVRAHARIITRPHYRSAVADLVERLESGNY